MKRVSIGIIIALSVGIFALSAMAYGKEEHRNSGMGKLNLTNAQQLQILQIRQSFERDTLPQRQEFQTKKLELHQFKAAKPVNQSLVDAKTKEIGPIKAQLGAKEKEMHDKILSVLTPDQQKKWNDMEAKEKDKKSSHDEKNDDGDKED
jgi:Spy/CpxP family protein refolding chaperone